MTLLKLLQSKTRCIEEFRRISKEFLALAAQGDLSQLTDFENNRDHLIRALQLHDRKISKIVSELPKNERTQDLIQTIENTLAHERILVNEILTIDRLIIDRIEDAKCNLLKSLNSSRKSREMVGKFKSKGSTGSGEELDRKL